MNINKAIKEELEKLILEQNRQRDVSAAPNRKNTLSNEEKNKRLKKLQSI